MSSTPDRLIDVFNGAKARPAGAERDAFLAEVCREDTELKKQVLSLLQAHESAGEFLAVRPPLSAELEAEFARLKPEEAGERIGPYKLREQIGEGGFGVVWVAEQREPVRRTVALKIIKLGMDTREVVTRFEQERQALAMMDHPNIARVFDAGATEHGRPFFVMELVRGIKITDYCDQANLPTAERLALFIQVCHAVQHAHQKGIIHRDLKPSNILVTLHDGVPVPKVIDFGVAKATQGRLTDNTVYTQYQQMIGTPLYMSPEQAEMSGLDVDTRTDIYALGVLLYELLTGRTPFDADTLKKVAFDEMRRLIREQEPQKPSTALDTMAQATLTSVAHHRASEPPKLIHAIRGDLDWIVMKALEKDRTRRYETMSDLTADIQRHLDDQPVLARPPTTLYRVRKSIRRNRLAYTSATVVLAALIGGLCVAVWGLVRERDARRQAETARQQAEAARNLARDEAERNEQIAKFFMTATGPGIWRGQDATMVRRILDGMSQAVGKTLTNQPAAQGDLWFSIGNTYAAVDDYATAITNLQNAVGAYRTAFGDEGHPRLARSLARLGRMESLNGDVVAARANAQQAVAMARLGNDPEILAVCLMDAAKSFHDSGRPTPEAIPLLREVMQLRRQTVPHLLILLDSTRLLVKALEGLVSNGQADEANSILDEELKIAPRDGDLLRLRRTLNGKRSNL